VRTGQVRWQKKKNPKKGLGFFARSQTKAHILRDQLAPVVEQEEEDEDEVFMEQKGEDLECDHDSDYASDCDDEVSSECSDLDEEDDLPFICEECGQIFKTQLWFCRHMARGKHKKTCDQYERFCAQKNAAAHSTVKAGDFHAFPENEG